MHKLRRLLVLSIILASALASTVQFAFAQDQTTVTFTQLMLGVGESGVVEGVIDCVSSTGCSAFAMTISFDPAMLRVDRVETGPYLGDQVFEAENSVDNTAGIIRLSATALTANPAMGEPVLMRLTITGVAPGITALTMSDLLIADMMGTPLNAVALGGAIAISDSSVAAPAATPSLSLPFGTGTPELAFYSMRDGNREIYIMNQDGSNVRRVTNTSDHEYEPNFSPDGSQIAFRIERGGGYDLYVMNADGSNVRNITNHSAVDAWPNWSPDGSLITFYTDRDGNFEIYVMNADGSNPRRLTFDGGTDSRPVWSPDGTQIAFRSDRDGDHDIYIMNADGSNVRNLTNNSYKEFGPTWSPDGSQIAFDSERNGNRDIYVINVDGTNERRLTTDSAPDTNPAWSPDGTTIAFLSERDGNREIYAMDADGSNQRNLTNHFESDWFPAWRPAP